MIDQIDRELLSWAESVAGMPTNLALPGQNASAEGVSLYLLELGNAPAPRTTRRTPLQISLRYLVTVRCNDVAQAHRVLWELLVAASERTQSNDWQVDPTPPPTEFWLACGSAPQPSFVLHVPVRHEWEERTAPRVRRAPEVGIAPLERLEGVVMGPDEIPISGAAVELPALGLTAYTERRGHFEFAAVPAGPQRPDRLLVRARGREQAFRLQPDSDLNPLVVRFTVPEE